MNTGWASMAKVNKDQKTREIKVKKREKNNKNLILGLQTLSKYVGLN